MLTIPVTILSTVYMCLLVVAYFSKDRIQNLENKIYSHMIKLTLFGIILDTISCIFVIYNMTGTLGFRVVTLLIFMYYILWSGLFLLYTYVISFRRKNTTEQEFYKKHKKKIKFICTFFIICTLAVPLMPLSYYEDHNVIFPMGLSVDFTYFIAGFLSMGLMLILMLINRKNIRSKKYVPVYSLIILFLVTVVIQKANPGLILTTTVECFITFLMYFTIENPDVQMMKELYKNKKIIEKSNEDTSRFLFRMTQDIKKPLKDAISISHDMIKMDNIEELKSASKYINNYANQIDYLMNKALNISNMDTQSIKVFDTRYNVNNLFKEVSFRAKEDIKPNLEFEFNISDNIPTYLYGDSIKLKQAISSVINIANDFTKEGFISLDVSSIARYNMCRLIITVEDSGRGIGIDRINQILSLTGDELKDIADTNSDDRNLDILAVKKVVSMLGGSLMIKSEEGVGTTVTIILEQKVVETKETELSKKLESYEQSLYGEKQVLIVDDDEKELDKIEKQISSDGIMVSSSVYGRECIEKVRSKLKYDLIILDDELGGTSALEVLKELQKIKNFKTPVVVMINDNKEGIKLHYLKDGFADTISKSKLESEIDRIMKRF